MKKRLFTLLALTAAMASANLAMAAEPQVDCHVKVSSYSNLTKMKAGDFSPNVLFKDVVLNGNSIAFGPGAKRAYEVTIVGGKLYMASPQGKNSKDGDGIKIRHQATATDGAAMLQLVTPTAWVKAEDSLDTISSLDDLDFALTGLNEDLECGESARLAFRIKGHAASLTWSMDTLPESKEVTTTDQDVEIIGIYTQTDKEKYFMVKGYNLHAHVLLSGKGQAGHLRNIELDEGATISLAAK